jgi:hypothetical protein
MHRRLFAFVPVMVAALLTTGCDDPAPAAPSAPPPAEINETFTGTVTVNGAQTHPFPVTTAGAISARFASLSVSDAVVGLSLGTWNGQVCQIILANDNATASSVVPGTASVGAFCVRVYDVGRLTGPLDYEVVVTHF